MKTWQRSLFALCALLALFGGAAYAQAPGAPPVEFPYTGNRTAVWIVAQLHILFAAFILGAPIFVVISEWLGYRKHDPRYDRLAKEVMKVTVILYSMTALTGGLFIFVLLATYPQFTTWLINHFFMLFAVIYPLLFIGETILLYLYFYSWDAWKGDKKARHIALGVLLNLIGTITLFVIDGPTSFMNTPGEGGRGVPNGISCHGHTLGQDLQLQLDADEPAPAGRECDVRRIHHGLGGRLHVHGGEERRRAGVL